jgi:transcriptional regulator with XRE-family HTH domain
LADLAGLTQSKISRVERGLSLPSVDEVRAWATACDATTDELGGLAAALEQVATSATSWRILHRLGVAQKQTEIAELERQASHIQTFQPAMIPGLLQTADYARRLLVDAFPDSTPHDIQARLERQSILYDEGKRFEFIITAAALQWRPENVNLQAQLAYLDSTATLPNVNIRVLPVGAPSPPVLHPFVIWELPGEVLVSVETYSAELWVREAADVARYQHVWSQLASATVPDTAAVLRGLVE